MKPIVQISLDLTSIPKPLNSPHPCVLGIDWLEAGTPLIIAEKEWRASVACRVPEDTDCGGPQTMDGGWLEAELMAKAGATLVVVMGQAHRETVELVARAGKDLGVKVMGDNLGMSDMVAGAKLLEDAGCD